jgi:ribosomal protein S18 acetylase RimI-like enzyme
MVTKQITVTPYARRYRHDLLRSLQTEYRVHTHLDWHTVDEWMNDPEVPFYVARADNKLIGAMAASPALGNATWLRLVIVGEDVDTAMVVSELWAALSARLITLGVTDIAVLLMQAWLTPHLAALGFAPHDDIVTLRRQSMHVIAPLRTDIAVRHADWRDVASVVEVDHAAFHPFWRLSESSLRQAARTSYSFTVAELNRRILGYQISTLYNDGAHLARLATLPEVHGNGVGGLLLGEMIGQYLRRGLMSITVNTQRTNEPSQRLYHRYGFELTGQSMTAWSAKLG